MSALKNITPAMAMSLIWKQWVPASGVLTAYAVDPTSEERTGKLRSLNGSLIPERAEPAAEGTPRDHFCEQLIARLAAGEIGKKKGPSPEKLAKRQAIMERREAEKARKKAEREAKAAETKLAREAQANLKKEEKAREKAAKKAEVKTAEAPVAPLDQKSVHLESTPGASLAIGRPPLKEGSYLVMYNGNQVGIVAPGKLIETEDAAEPRVVLTEKSWAVYQGKDRKAFGVIKTPAA